VGALAVGTAVFSASGVLSCVTNASLKEAVGVTVSAMASKAMGSVVCVGITATGVEVGGMPPGGVGVKYCPHNEAFPEQDASKNDAAIIKLMSRFTK
jgi:hypothetical protein